MPHNHLTRIGWTLICIGAIALALDLFVKAIELWP